MVGDGRLARSTSCSRRCAAPRRSPSSTAASFDGVLDMLSGRYPSDEFAELRPRVTWDRVQRHRRRARGRQARRDRQRRHHPRPRPLRRLPRRRRPPAPRASASSTKRWCSRARVGETFVLGASTWRIEEITHDRVLVSPAPGEPGKMPFWKGDAAGPAARARPRDRRADARRCCALPPAAALDRLDARARPRSRRPPRTCCSTSPIRTRADRRRPRRPHHRHRALPRRARRLARLPAVAARRPGPSRRGRWRSSPKIREETGIDVETLWTDDGFVVRFPDTDEPPDPRLLLPDPDEVEALVLRQLGATSLFAAKFRESGGARAAAAAPAHRRRARRCGSSASAPPTCWRWPSRFGSFPMLLETYRECLRDLFDLPALVETLRDDPRARTIRVVTVDSTTPSPFAASLLFGYVAQLPLRRRRAARRAPRPGAVDRSGAAARSCSATPSCATCSTATPSTTSSASCSTSTPERHVKTADGLHDLLLRSAT